jgi:hypothetical protein
MSSLDSVSISDSLGCVKLGYAGGEKLFWGWGMVGGARGGDHGHGDFSIREGKILER